MIEAGCNRFPETNRAGGAQVPPAVVVHAGARDSYQLSRALYDGGLLQALVTNVYSKRWVQSRYELDLPFGRVKTPLRSMVAFSLMRVGIKRDLHRFSDHVLSKKARAVAERTGSAVFAYSYYAGEVFDPELPTLPYRFLFQLHPHPRSVRRILTEELDRTPSGRGSLLAEPDLRLNDRAFDRLAAEPHLANGLVVASSFTRSTLAENGIDPNQVHVAPYGVDRLRYTPRARGPSRSEPLTVIWVGTLSQRKGLSYLLDAIRLVKSRNIRVRLRGHGHVDDNLLREYSDLPLDVRVKEPLEAVVKDLHSSDVYVLPSLVEGFGQSILEAMSCGLPVIATPNTCAPDLITEGREGFVIPIRSAEAIAGRLDWALTHRQDLAAMGQAASSLADRLTWANFRRQILQAYSEMVENCRR